MIHCLLSVNHLFNYISWRRCLSRSFMLQTDNLSIDPYPLTTSQLRIEYLFPERLNVAQNTVPSFNLFYGHAVLNVSAKSIRQRTEEKRLFFHNAKHWNSLTHHHQNHSTNKVKNQRGKRRWIFKQSRYDSGLCDVSCGRYSKKCFSQSYKAMYGDAICWSLWRAQIWRPEANKNICP